VEEEEEEEEEEEGFLRGLEEGRRVPVGLPRPPATTTSSSWPSEEKGGRTGNVGGGGCCLHLGGSAPFSHTSIVCVYVCVSWWVMVGVCICKCM